MARQTGIAPKAIAAAFLLLAAGSVATQQTASSAEVKIGYVDLADDPRFDPDYAYNYVPVRPWGRSIGGARLGIADAAQIGRVIDVDFTLEKASGSSAEELVGVIEGWVADGVNFVVADLPADLLLELADKVAVLPVTIFNVSAHEDILRGEACRSNIVHTIASYRMITDAMVQYLVSRRWRDILVLQGQSDADQKVVDALQQSAKHFGANVVDVRPFILTADPRQRDQSNVALVTADGRYDVVYVADSDGEFARYAPYQTNAPRPVVGSAGLVSLAWHWSWERQGGPQVNDRFEDMSGRRMERYDWAAWAAVRAVTQSVLRSNSTDYEPVRDYLLSERMNLDGAKGNPMSFRPWDHQLRQGMLLATGNAVMQLAPVEGFLHRTNDLDTLGVDAPQSVCRF